MALRPQSSGGGMWQRCGLQLHCRGGVVQRVQGGGWHGSWKQFSNYSPISVMLRPGGREDRWRQLESCQDDGLKRLRNAHLNKNTVTSMLGVLSLYWGHTHIYILKSLKLQSIAGLDLKHRTGVRFCLKSDAEPKMSPQSVLLAAESEVQ